MILKLTDRFMPMKEATLVIEVRGDGPAMRWLLRHDVCLYKMGNGRLYVTQHDLNRAVMRANASAGLGSALAHAA